MDEEAKAAREIAKTTGIAIKAAEKLVGFLRKICGDALIETGGSLHDWAILYRYKNLLKIQDKVDEIHRNRKAEGRTIPIPPRYAIPLIQNASMEDEETLQDLWAGLMANATDQSSRLQVKKVYIEILSNLEPMDALVLGFLADRPWAVVGTPHPRAHIEGFNLRVLSEELRVSMEDLQISIQNLARLGLLIDEKSFTWEDLNTPAIGARINDPDLNFRPSPLAASLLEACEA